MKPEPRTGRPWTTDELAILRAHAPLGSAAIHKQLPHRSIAAIKVRAIHIGCRIGKVPDGRALGNAWRGRLPIPKHAHPLVKRIFVEMNRQRATLYEVAERSGVHWQAISAWRYNRVPRVDNVIAVANSLGLNLMLVPQREEREAA